ncbi:peptidase E [Tamlana sp. 2_MG-2023]|uniref:DUF6702 family protein n=1 Tax=unclassified Tamlana TaxID=2614803 RepID=UPI0026E3FE1E|nr:MULTISPECIES: DUF6702 family protein [unclassified Tamlana]MDO6760313.1 peptidase E [Tamlana sp. 2_MG-2023]MDO6789989.1 peptidase E [Tamlana sp. 1_MG-2023]
MKLNKLLLLLLMLPLCAFSSLHKYYISVTQIEYIEEKASVQIISRIFIDDFERLLRERYDDSITLAGKNESPEADAYIARYLSDKLKIHINGADMQLKFIGKAYEADVMKCYLEIEGVQSIKSLGITNNVLFDVFEDQQNIIKTKINSKQKSFILYPQKDYYMLKF